MQEGQCTRRGRVAIGANVNAQGQDLSPPRRVLVEQVSQLGLISSPKKDSTAMAQFHQSHLPEQETAMPNLERGFLPCNLPQLVQEFNLAGRHTHAQTLQPNPPSTQIHTIQAPRIDELLPGEQRWLQGLTSDADFARTCEEYAKEQYTNHCFNRMAYRRSQVV